MMSKKQLLENKLRKMVREVLNEDMFHPKDTLMHGITYEDLIDTVFSNEQVRDERTVRRVFEEMIRDNATNARNAENFKNIKQSKINEHKIKTIQLYNSRKVKFNSSKWRFILCAEKIQKESKR